MNFRKTIARPVSVQGIGLHNGATVKMTLRPASPGSGVVFVRLDQSGSEIPALHRHVSQSAYATTLSCQGTSVATVEHILSAVVGLGIDDLRVELDGGEVPILDGSAAPFVQLLAEAGTQESTIPRQAIRVDRPLEIRDGEKSIEVAPGRGLEIHYSIDFQHPVLGNSEKFFRLKPRNYARDIAPARTFCRLEEVEALRQKGLVKGGSLENALVVDQNGPLNGPLRFVDEFVRHKILDLLGDLALLGRPLMGKITAVRAGHSLHSMLLTGLLAHPDSWSLVPATAVPRQQQLPALAVSA